MQLMCLRVSLVAGTLLFGLTAATHATIITTDSVDPAGLGPGNEVISSGGLTVGGDFTTPDTGTVTISDGTSLTVNGFPFANIAPLNGSNGTVTVTGTNVTPSTFRLEGTDGLDGAFLSVGRGGVGNLNITGGAKVEIDSLGAPLARDVAGAGFPAGFWVGGDAGSDGTINLSGSSSQLSVASDFAFGQVGAEGNGLMNITDNASLTFSGINSDFNVGSDVFDPVGPGSGVRTGVLNVNTGGSLSGNVFLDVGGSPGGSGTVNLTGPTSRIILVGACTPDCPPGYSFPNQGAFLTVGANQGSGVVNVTGGALFTIDSSGTAGAEFPGFSLGGSSILGPMGDGTINVDGANSEILVKGDQGFFSVGRLENGLGKLNISNGGKVTFENADGASAGFVGDRPGAEGTVIVSGSTSIFDAGNFIGVGVNSLDFSDAGKGTVKLVDSGTLLADNVQIAAGGEIIGNGTLAGNTGPTEVRVSTFGKISPGLSTGQIIIDGDLILEGGSAALEANSLLDMDKIVVLGDLILLDGFIDVLLGFVPGLGEVLDFFDVAGAITIDPAFDGINAFVAPGSGVPGGAQVVVGIGGQQFVASATSTPEPTTLALLGLGLLGVGYARRKNCDSSWKKYL